MISFLHFDFLKLGCLTINVMVFSTRKLGVSSNWYGLRIEETRFITSYNLKTICEASVIIVYFPDEETEAQTGDLPNVTEGGSDRARTGTQSPSASPQLHTSTFVHTIGTGDCGVIARGQCSENWLLPESLQREKATSNFPLTSNRNGEKVETLYRVCLSAIMRFFLATVSL